MGEPRQISTGRLRELLGTPYDCMSPYPMEALVAGREFYQWLRRTRLSDDADWDMFFSVKLPRGRYLVVVVSENWSLDDAPREVISSRDALRLLGEAIEMSGERSVYVELAELDDCDSPWTFHLSCDDPGSPDALEPTPVVACKHEQPGLSLRHLIARCLDVV